MKRNLFGWLLVLVIFLSFVASVCNADILAIRCIVGLPDHMTFTETPVDRFAINTPYKTTRSLTTDEIVGNFPNDSIVLQPEIAETTDAWPLSGNLMILLVIGLGDADKSGNTIIPAALPESVNVLKKRITTIVLEIEVPASSALQQHRIANSTLQLIAPEPVSFQGALEPVSSKGNTQSIEIARTRGPVK